MRKVYLWAPPGGHPPSRPPQPSLKEACWPTQRSNSRKQPALRALPGMARLRRTLQVQPARLQPSCPNKAHPRLRVCGGQRQLSGLPLSPTCTADRGWLEVLVLGHL